MDINASNLANREIALNKYAAGAEVLNKTIEKKEEVQQVNRVEKAQDVQNEKPKGNHIIDTYA